MSGHSKWSTIKHKKGAKDAKRGVVFTKLAKMITMAAKEGGADPEMNFRLKLAVDKARAANMPNDNIQRAIDKGAGTGADGVQIEEITYEVYGPEATAVLVTCLTDNTNRALSDMKGVFAKQGGAMGGPGSVAWMFEKKGLIQVSASSVKDLDEITLSSIDAGATEVEEDDEIVEFYCLSQDLKRLKDFLDEQGLVVESAELINKPKDLIKIEEEVKRDKIVKFLETIEELDDVERVDTNIDFSS